MRVSLQRSDARADTPAMARIRAAADARPIAVDTVQVRPALIVAGVLAAAALLATMAMVGTTVAHVVGGGYGTNDFISFYAAGNIVRTGHGARLYDIRVQEVVERIHYPDGFRNTYAYVLPVFAAWIFAPFSKLPFAPAVLTWMALQTLLLAGLVRGLSRHLAGVPALPRNVFLGVFALSMPAVTSIIVGEVDLIVFAGVLLGYLLLRRDRQELAGLALSLALFKPHLVIGIVLMLLVWRQWRTLLPFAAAATALLVIPALLTSPGLLVANARLLAHFPASGQHLSIDESAMPNWRGFVVSATGEGSMWLWLPGLLVIAGAAIAIALPRWRAATSGGVAADQSYALAVLLPLLISPHLHTQSLVLLFVPGAILLRGVLRPDSGGNVLERQLDVVTVLLLVFAAMFVLWYLAVTAVALTVFPLMLFYWLCAHRWPAGEAPPPATLRTHRFEPTPLAGAPG